MKKIVIVCGLISGLIVSLTMLGSIVMCYNDPEFKGNMVIGFASMFLAFSLIFVGIKNYRDKINNGTVTFGKAFLTGLYISLIASTMYVGVWLIDYYVFVPDFMEKYTAHVLKEAQQSGISAAEMQVKVKDMEDYKEMYKNPIYVILLTYMEILPLGVLVSLICALILKRKEKVSKV